MIKIAIIGASYLQLPLIRKAKDKDMQTHVFAWRQMMQVNSLVIQYGSSHTEIKITKDNEIKIIEIGGRWLL